MPKRTRVVIGGVDTHGRTHHAAVIDEQGRLLNDQEFAATSSGYRQLLGWLGRHGRLEAVGVEGTGSYGAGLTRYLLDQHVAVVEVDRPDRRTRRQRGKSDPIDAETAARAVLAGTATAPAKRRDGIVEAIRALRAVRSGAIKARTAAINQLKGLLVSAPTLLREDLDQPSTAALVATCARLRPDEAALADPVHATKAALRVVACRIQQLDEEINQADQRLATLVGRAAPRLLELHAIGVDHAGQLLTTAGDNPERLRGEAAFAHLCGPPRSPPVRARPIAIGCIVAVTATPTGRCIWRSWSACAALRQTLPGPRGLPRPGRRLRGPPRDLTIYTSIPGFLEALAFHQRNARESWTLG